MEGSSLLTQVTLPPAAIVIVAGPNWLSTIETTTALCARTARAGCPAVEASSATASAPAAGRVGWKRRISMGLLPSGRLGIGTSQALSRMSRGGTSAQEGADREARPL